MANAGMVCGSGYCDREAVAALYVRGSDILVRVDHLYGRPIRLHDNVVDMRCMDCLLNDMQAAVVSAAIREEMLNA